MKKTIYYLCGGLIFFLILLISIEFYSLNSFFYFNQYDKNDVYQNITYSKEDVKSVTYNLINYLKSDSNLEYKDVFSDKEKRHMKDVKYMFEKGILIKRLAIIAICTIIYVNRKDIENILKCFNKSILTTCVVSTLLCSIISLNYYRYFTIFHKMFFNNDDWLLSPKESIIINLLPLEFFKSISIYIFITTIIVSCIVISINFFLIKRKKLEPKL
ncbi:TIGR01906 family membrane protein [Tepidibacter hydrothermalis]|uniref:TIGR01906 family membrane protein n=1 Tax=Tepidibacter hydrothermalis TaxID=3036126 RepID=A0ABY8E8P7_9FIRM|nr:TIGR01906 family membrane protein [Tepidibacter hydrothermalis]WFD09196.1 TIGR01906 family membrane protein [Tepidibacter hydrothermalis]